MAQLSITAQPRQESGSRPVRRLRRAGKVPGVIYGQRLDRNINITLEAGPLEKLLQSQGAGGLIEVRVDGGVHSALIKEVQRDPTQGQILHVDFHAVSMDEEVHVMVAIQLTGEDARPNDGGVVTQYLREVGVHCLPTAIPESLTLDVSGLAIGDSLTLSDIRYPEGVRPVAAGDEIVVSVTSPAREAETEAGDEGAESDEAGGDEPDQEAGESEAGE